MNAIFLKQKKPVKVNIFGITILVLLSYMLYSNEILIPQTIVLLIIAIVLLGYSFSYEINEDFNNFKHFELFGFTISKSKLNLDYPDYISIFSSSFKLDNEWGAVSAIGTKEKHNSIVINFFKGKKNDIVYKSNNYEELLQKATSLGELLGIEIHNTLKK